MGQISAGVGLLVISLFCGFGLIREAVRSPLFPPCLSTADSPATSRVIVRAGARDFSAIVIPVLLFT